MQSDQSDIGLSLGKLVYKGSPKIGTAIVFQEDKGKWRCVPLPRISTPYRIQRLLSSWRGLALLLLCVTAAVCITFVGSKLRSAELVHAQVPAAPMAKASPVPSEKAQPIPANISSVPTLPEIDRSPPQHSAPLPQRQQTAKPKVRESRPKHSAEDTQTQVIFNDQPEQLVRQPREILVAIPNVSTIVVPDRSGKPVSVSVGKKLPSGAVLVSVDQTRGVAETDRGTLRLE